MDFCLATDLISDFLIASLYNTHLVYPPNFVIAWSNCVSASSTRYFM